MKYQSVRLALSATLLMIAIQGASAQAPDAPADNSKSNKIDPSNSSQTADTQKDDESDRTLTQQIRKSIMSDSSLSTYAHNVKIISVDGTVTLNGVVRSNEEKRSVEMKAVAVVGKDHVVNDLKVAPST